MKKAEVKKGKKKNVLKEYWPLYLMMLPALLYLLINNYIPMAGMVLSLIHISDGFFIHGKKFRLLSG